MTIGILFLCLLENLLLTVNESLHSKFSFDKTTNQLRVHLVAKALG